jgi:hypothetical protein
LGDDIREKVKINDIEDFKSGQLMKVKYQDGSMKVEKYKNLVSDISSGKCSIVMLIS